MKLFDYAKKQYTESEKLSGEAVLGGELFIFCRTNELPSLKEIFGFDESTVLDCTDLDESVRFTSYDGYDFVSLVHMETGKSGAILREINLYVSKSYLVLVMPEHESDKMLRFEASVLETAKHAGEKKSCLNRVYFSIFNELLSDYSDLLESMEDDVESLSESIIKHVEKIQFTNINYLRKLAYTAQKQLRALSGLGEHILVDENGIIEHSQNRYFANVDSRFKKLYGFAENLYDLSGGLLDTYDGKLSMKTNDIVTKLTVLTVFFAPLTVISGIYGMNFEFMPELKNPLGYPMTLASMLLVCVLIYVILKLKKWM